MQSTNQRPTPRKTAFPANQTNVTAGCRPTTLGDVTQPPHPALPDTINARGPAKIEITNGAVPRIHMNPNSHAPPVDDREQLRTRYRPPHIRLLFIGESPPASGRFFYHQNSGLYRALRDAFSAIDPAVNDANFLDLFRDSGCYLVDLAAQPVDHLDPKARRATLAASVNRLAATIVDTRPDQVAILLRSIRPHVEEALRRASWSGPLGSLPYPGRWHRHRLAFVEQLRPALTSLLENAER